jgi:hypothetical protein
MPQLSAETKHAILLHARSRGANQSLDDVAAVHGVAGGRRTLAKWRRKWDGTPRSLQRKAGSGKQRILSRAQVSQHVRAPILAANRAHRAIHYTTLLPSVREKTRKKVSLRSLQRLGKQELGVKRKHTKKRTADEGKCTREREDAPALCAVLRADSLVQCLLPTVTRSQRCDASCRRSAATTSSSSMRLHSV